MVLNYEKATVVWTYHHATQGDYNPTAQELVDWDLALFARYDDKLDAPMTAAGLTLDRATKSQVVALAEVSFNPNDTTAVKNACRFLAAVPVI